MAIVTISATNVQFSTFDDWSNAGFTADTDINLSSVLTDSYPASSAPYSVSDFYNRSFFYGNIICDGNNTNSVQVTAPYTSATSTGTLAVKNVDYGTYASITFTATAGYGITFNGWYTAASGGGTQITTNTTLTLTVSDQTSIENFYAYFT